MILNINIISSKFKERLNFEGLKLILLNIKNNNIVGFILQFEIEFDKFEKFLS